MNNRTKPEFTRLNVLDGASIIERFCEGFDTKEIRDQLVYERLAQDRPALFHESQIYNELARASGSVATQIYDETGTG